MKQLPYWHSVELTAGSRPILRENEVDVIVEDNIGLYQGKSKILQRQNGRVYLTSQRLIYIDNNNANHLSLSVELSDVKTIEYTSKFLKSSSKINIFFKKIKQSSNTGSSTAKETTKKAITQRTTNWICPICSYSNEVSIHINFTKDDSLPNCATCGIKASSELIESSVKNYIQLTTITSKSNETEINSFKPLKPSNNTTDKSSKKKKKQIECPACTFHNHISLTKCEICGTTLPLTEDNNSSSTLDIYDDRIKIETDTDDGLDESKNPFIKLSFHKHGDKIFYNKLLEILEKVQWETVVQNGNVNRDALIPVEKPLVKKELMNIGLHGLAKKEDLKLLKNEQIINSSLDDLHDLLAKANEILELAKSFKNLTDSNINVEKIITNDIMRNDNDGKTKVEFYLKETSRKISEFLINEGHLMEQGGIITLLDLYALFNKGRIGLNLISPLELYQACQFFPKLQLPLILKKINSVLVVQSSIDKSNDDIIKDIIKFIESYGDFDETGFKYSNILKISDFFNWSLTITEEFLIFGLDLGYLVIDEEISGKHYYLNLFKDDVDFNKILQQNLEQENKLTYEIPKDFTARIESTHEEISTEQVKTDQLPKQKVTITELGSVSTVTFPTVPHKKIISNNSVSKTLEQLSGLEF